MIELLADNYALWLADLVGWIVGAETRAGSIYLHNLVLQVTVECTALSITAVVGAACMLLSPGTLLRRFGVAVAIGLILQACNVCRLIALAGLGNHLGLRAFGWSHDLIAPLLVSLVVLTAWIYLCGWLSKPKVLAGA